MAGRRPATNPGIIDDTSYRPRLLIVENALRPPAHGYGIPTRKDARPAAGVRSPVKPLHILVDAGIPGAERTFGRHGSIERFQERMPSPASVARADALVVRSVTRVGPELLSDSRVRFIGTATIGTDHLDTGWLERHAIQWISAPGCNADSAAQYTLGMILLAAQRLDFDLARRRIGIVGCGNVGGRVVTLLDRLGFTPAALIDPPRTAAGERGFSDPDSLRECDLVSFHVPLTQAGRWPTRGLVDRKFLAGLSRGTLIVNTSRGDVVDGTALGRWLEAGGGHVALDVWPGEPQLSPDLLRRATVATPHVAGYSQDGKLRGTELVYRGFRRWLGLDDAAPDLRAGLPSVSLPSSAYSSVADAVLAACPVARDDAALRALASEHQHALGPGFDQLRRSYPERRDFSGWQLPKDIAPDVWKPLRDLGFR